MFRRPAVLLLLSVLLLAGGGRARGQTCVTPFDCDDLSDCTTDGCIAGACTYAPLPDGDGCSDQDGCTEGDTCAGGVCQPGPRAPDCRSCADNDDCEDGDDCSVDFCDLGRCEREGGPGEPCDDQDPCTTDDRCSDGRCAGAPLRCDDGVACTSDFCDAGRCASEPDGSRCAVAGECATVECRPDEAGADASGCVALGESFEQMECTDDADPCTADRCRAARCSHDRVADGAGCEPLRPSYRNAVELRRGVERVLNYLFDEVDAGGDTADAMTGALDGLGTSLDGAVRALGGREGGEAVAQSALRGLRLAANPTVAQARGRLALAWLRGAPGQTQRFLAAVSRGRRQGDLADEDARELRRNGRILLADTKALKRDVKNLQRTFSVFQR